jgi:lipoyl-dependent peroxiredoxin
LNILNKITTMKRHATAIWKGSGKDGKGTVSTQSGLLSNAQYSYKSRFEEGTGTNPEELVAAAHAGCFDMKLSFVLQEAGFTADSLETTAEVTLENGAVTKSHLILKAKIPGISQEQFDKAAEEAKANCPISKLLNAELTLDKTLES